MTDDRQRLKDSLSDGETIGTVRFVNEYSDGQDNYEIWITKDHAKILPFIEDNAVDIRLIINNMTYSGKLRSTTENDYVWVSPTLYDENDKRIRLSDVLIGNGINRNQKLILHSVGKNIYVKKQL